MGPKKVRTPAAEALGKRFGKLVVIEVFNVPGRKGALAKADCDCGKKWEGAVSALRRGATKSCGCLNVESHRTHGFSYHPLYDTWASIKGRCLNPNKDNYKHYGGRGVLFYPLWADSPSAFIDWVESNMGPRPSPKHTIDRIDNEHGHYFPGNLRWATQEEQANNRRGNRPIEYRGRTQTLPQWCSELGLSQDRTRARLYYGWTVDEAFATPTDGKRYYRRQLSQSGVMEVE